MQPITLDIWSVLLGFGALNGYFMAIILWRHSEGKRTSNRLLALLLFSISLFVTELIIARSSLYFEYPFLILSSFSFAYLISPLFYGYARSLFSELSISLKELVHLIPLLLALAALIPFYFFTVEEKTAYVQLFQDPEYLTFRHLWLGGIFLVQSVLYLSLIFFTLKRFQITVKEQVSGKAIDHLNWLYRLVIIFTVSIVLNAVVSLLMVTGDLKTFPGVELTLLTFTVFVHIVAYNAIRHPQRIFLSVSSAPKYAHSTLKSEERKLKIETIKQYMVEKKPYLDAELTLAKLSAGLNLHPDHVSQIINAEANTSFYDFINKYRVKEAKQNLIDPSNNNLSILGIALNCGFNSKTSFNRIFKKTTGLTPSEYISQLKTS